jgi:hypothetical protein
MIHIDFFRPEQLNEDRDVSSCFLCRQPCLATITLKSEKRQPIPGRHYTSTYNIWLCQEHLKELHNTTDPLRVLVMTGKNIKE